MLSYYYIYIQSNIYEIFPINNHKLIIYIYYLKPILMFVVIRLDVVLYDNKYVLTHSLGWHAMLAQLMASTNAIQKDA